MTRATPDLMDAIHGMVAGSLKTELERAMERAKLPIDDENYAPLNPQLIDKAMKFLKDNGVDAPAKSERIDALQGQLNQLDLGEEADQIQRTH